MSLLFGNTKQTTEVRRYGPVRIAVIVATKGRPQAVNQLLRLLEEQTRLPSVVVVSATEHADIQDSMPTSPMVEYTFGPAGLTCQRNRALERTRDRSDIVVFFDDDFAPSPTWLEHCANAFISDSSVVGMCGLVLRDGAVGEEISWEEAGRLIHGAAPADSTGPLVAEPAGLYGCNMAYRTSAIRDVVFDERLVLYGWLEDKDFSRLAGKMGRLVKCNALVGVHLGIKSGRVSGRKYGYSQVVNAWYLREKGTLTSKEAWSNIGKALLANGAKALWPEKHIDRLGRLTGNLIGLGNVMLGHCRPEQAAEL
jgi:glycosyltransferase involved in cell wall biosynthesis